MNRLHRNSSLTAVACTALLLGAGLSFGALAQAWPSRPITWLYPFGESAATAFVRTIASELSKSLGQPVLVENRPGAGGRIGMTALVAGKPDGHVIAAATTAMLTYQPLTSASFKIEPVRNYAPVTQLYNLNLIIYGSTKVPYNDVKGLMAYARANPGKLNFGSTGIGSAGHFAVEVLNVKAGVNIVHVPYKGEGEQTAAAINGDLHLFITTGGPKPNVDAGRLQVIATAGDSRSKLFPDKPTVREQGVDFSIAQWMGVVAPAGLPADIANRLGLAIRNAMKEPAVMKAAEVAGVEPTFDSSPEAFNTLIRGELKALEPVLKATGIVTE